MARPALSSPLAVSHPEVAERAYGWNPSEYSAGSCKTVEWRCTQESCGHIWSAIISSITRYGRATCPACSNRVLVPGNNDLATKYPALAKQLVDVDSSSVIAGGHTRYGWKCDVEACNFVWVTSVQKRIAGQGCPACQGKHVVLGYNDLASRFPELAKQAHGFDPSTVTCGTDRLLEWKCSKPTCGYVWKASAVNRTNQNTGCPVCSGRVIARGINDLGTTHPDLALELVDTSQALKVSAGSDRKLTWKCISSRCGNTWSSSVSHRVAGRGCPSCMYVRPGDNDLATRFPLLALEAHGWDPSIVAYASTQRLPWKCGMPTCGHVWTVTVGTRTSGGGCPACARYGFQPTSPGYVYLLERDISGERHHKIGITNQPEVRLKAHERNGWHLLEISPEMLGARAEEAERAVLKALTERGIPRGASIFPAPFDGWTEAWAAKDLTVTGLQDLREKLNVQMW